MPQPAQALGHTILARSRPGDFGPTLLSDFTLDSGQPVPPQTVLGPLCSLYGLDLAAGVAVFVETPPELDLTAAAFVQLDQFKHALRVITVALPDLPAVAALMPEPDQRIFLFSMGRCGSTLASRMLAQVPGVYSLSEPGPFLTLALARHTLPRQDQQNLLSALTRLLFRPRSAQDRVLALKFHSQVLFQADLIWAAFPDARFVFQYRDGVTWAKSFSRFMQMMNVPLLLQGDATTFTWMMMTAAAPFSEFQALHDTSQPLHHEDLLAPGWARHMQEYQRLRGLQMPIFPLHYNALNTDPDGSLTTLLSHCGLAPLNPDRLAQVLAQDSQEGTVLARSASPPGFTADAANRFRAVLSRVAPGLDPDTVLPA